MSKLLTPEDIRNEKKLSGFSYVQKDTRVEDTRFSKPFQAYHYVPGGGPTRPRWIGPRRATAMESAQDYCDRINDGKTELRLQLKSAGHKIPRTERQPSEAEVELRKLQKEVAKEKETQQGYIYCIAEEYLPYARWKWAGNKQIGAEAVKIGYSVNPSARIATLQTGNPRKLILVGTFQGTEEDEAKLHQEFIDQNILQEWFEPTDELLSMFE